MTKKFVMWLKSYSCSEIDIPRKHCDMVLEVKLFLVVSLLVFRCK